MYKIYIIDHEHYYSQVEEKILQKQGALVIGAQCRTEQEVVSIAGDADGLLESYIIDSFLRSNSPGRISL
jgi:D-3-phosphoglycerate dehydrogenase